MGIEAIEDFVYSDDEDTTAIYKPELAIISAPTILFTLEAGVGNKTLPMLLLHIGFQSNINDWSTKTVRYMQSSYMNFEYRFFSRTVSVQLLKYF